MKSLPEPCGSVPALEIIDGQPMTTSLKVAQYFGKRHDNVLQAIRRLTSEEDLHFLNFKETFVASPIPNGGTRNDKVYYMTKDGFYFLVLGFTGKQALLFRAAFIKEFNRMDEELRGGKAIDNYAGQMLMQMAAHYQREDKMIVCRSKYEAMKSVFSQAMKTSSQIQSNQLELQMQTFEAITDSIDSEWPLSDELP
ncbi:Rha family transcriptional regulator [Photobacterium galatheae]|uniref:Rha family transcriptional regulator n=1 Tax=Photobacterium galatheae TaxID=1654360 RepID=UPI00068F3ADD|nr:Rha family transcriptional regulator [Photobacterium galatheae]MCM0151632.1 Rha family transcriptional regulator [Photobacterium galatheae]